MTVTLSSTVPARARHTLERWKADPVAMVVEEFGAQPDIFQVDLLRAFARDDIRRIALKSCKGPGKTAGLVWCGLNFLATRGFLYPGHNTKIGCTSITGDNLDMNLWPEFQKWMSRSEFFRTAFNWTKTRIHARGPRAEQVFCERRTWPKRANQDEQADALAGLHADHVAFLLDESGGIPQAVAVTAEAILATLGQEGKIIQAGNPTHVAGPLHRACTTDRHLWHVITITGDPDSPRRSTRIDLAWAQEQIAQYGRDNPWVLVNVLGEFPPASINALLGLEEVEAAMRRQLRPDQWKDSDKRIGVDVARFGDDTTVFFPRQGLMAFVPTVLRQQNTSVIAARLAQGFVRWDADMILIDESGHWGHGVVDQLLTNKYPIHPILGEDAALDRRYKNRRCECWLEMAKWVRYGVLPYMPSLIRQLTLPTYTFVGGKFVLEPKDQIKARLGESPNEADALSETFALPERPSKAMQLLRGTSHARIDFDPLVFGPANDQAETEFNPYGGNPL